MKNIAKYLLTLAAVIGLSACTSDTEGDAGDVGGVAAADAGPVSLEPAQEGRKVGDQADLDARVGNTVRFGYDKYNLDAAAARTLKKQALWLKAFPEVNVVVEGHCDERGTRKYNQALGARRADAAKRYLIANGVAARRITTVSYGKDKPVAPGTTEADYAQNRRAATVIVAK
jgi:peptidoglycan-associated lipoprotein